MYAHGEQRLGVGHGPRPNGAMLHWCSSGQARGMTQE